MVLGVYGMLGKYIEVFVYMGNISRLFRLKVKVSGGEFIMMLLGVVCSMWCG